MGSVSVPTLPTTLDEVTASWVSSILNTPVSSLVTHSVRHGSSTTLFIEPVYPQDSNSNSTSTTKSATRLEPSRIVVKGGFNPQLIALAPAIQATYRREADFYAHIAPLLHSSSARLPCSFFAATDRAGSGQGIVVLEDLSLAGCEFGSPEDTWPVERVKKGVDQLALLHARTKDVEREDWLRAEGSAVSDVLRGMVVQLLQPGPFEAVVPNNLSVLSDQEEEEEKKVLLDRERILGAFQALWKGDEESGRFRSLTHGDPHVDNTYWTADGEPGFLDWQAAGPGNGFHDVAYFVASALSVEDRRRYEKEVVRYYVACLAKYGGEGGREVDWETAWLEYRRHLLHGYVLCLAQPGMQPQEAIWALVKRFTKAIFDHKVVELVEGEGK